MSQQALDYRQHLVLFVDDAAFDALLAEEAFVEWAHVHRNRYGTRRQHVNDMVAAGKIPLLDIDVQGGVQVLDQYGSELVSVFQYHCPSSLTGQRGSMTI